MHEPGTWLGTSRWPQLRDAGGSRRMPRGDRRRSASTGLVVIGGDGSAQGARALAAPCPWPSCPPRSIATSRAPTLTIGMDSAIAYAIGRHRPLARHGALAARPRLPRADARRAQRLPRRRGRRRRRASTTSSSRSAPSTWTRSARRLRERVGRRLGDRRHVGGRRRRGPHRRGAGERAAACACTRRSSAMPSAPRPRRRSTAPSARRPAAPRSAALAAGESTFVGLTADGAVAPAPLERRRRHSLRSTKEKPP